MLVLVSFLPDRANPDAARVMPACRGRRLPRESVLATGVAPLRTVRRWMVRIRGRLGKAVARGVATNVRLRLGLRHMTSRGMTT
eukprot:1187030-Prorocentrum_minimum.AAC.3